MKKNKSKKSNWLMVIIVLVTGFWLYREINKVIKEGEEIPEVMMEEYGQGWVEEEGEEVYKVQKEDGEFRETVAVNKSRLESDDYVKEIDKYIRGAKATIPSLVISGQRVEEDEEYWLKIIEGWYTNQGRKIGLIQRVLVEKKNNEANIISGSYLFEEEEEKAGLEEVMKRVEMKLRTGEI